jgi:mannosyltransferase
MSTSEFPAKASVADSELPGLGATSAVRRIPAELWIVAGLVLVAAAIRIVTLGSQSFWTDEALTAYETHVSFGGMINTVAHVETTPPLYFVVIWCWAKIFGSGEVALRSFSALAGVAMVPIAYLCARELFSRWAGVVAAAFAAVNPFLVWYSQEARSYMLLAVLSGVSFLWFIRATRDPSRRNLAWWSASSALALMTHFFAGFLVAPEALWLAWLARTRIVAIAVGVVATVQLAMLPFALIDTGHGAGWIHAIPRTDRIAQVPLQFGLSSLYRRVSVEKGLIGGAILIALVAVLLALGRDARALRGAKLAGGIAAAVLVVPLALGFVGPDYFLARNVIPAWIPICALVALACSAARPRLLGTALAAVMIAGFAIETGRIQSLAYLQRPQWRDVASVIGPATVPRAILAAGGATANPLKIYLPHVSWVQPRRRLVVIREVDVVGTRSPLRLESQGPASTGAKSTGVRSIGRKAKAQAPTVVGVALPRLSSTADIVAIRRVRVHGWVVSRFRLVRPWRVNIDQLTARSPRFFRRAPQWVLAFIQLPGR